jgi:riboflavin kinase/FMN adenylyltransferase
MNSSNVPVVVTIGVFDGVHAGHRQVLGIAKSIASSINGTLTAATFDPPPKAFLRPDSFTGLLTLPKRRANLLRENGVDHVETLKFTDAMAHMSSDEFVEEILLGALNAQVVIVGRNFRFGHGASGTVETLQDLAKKFGFEVRIVDLVGDASAWSSTRIRNAILKGHVEGANGLLGRAHRVSGEVVHGDHRGREIGYPTANIEVIGGLLIPSDGVYSGLLWIDGVPHDSAISVGTNPTFDDVTNRRVEAYVIGQTDLDLYGKVVDLDFISHIRDMESFAGIPELLEAMDRDINTAKLDIEKYLNRSK